VTTHPTAKQMSSLMAVPACRSAVKMHSDLIVHAHSETRHHAPVIHCGGQS